MKLYDYKIVCAGTEYGIKRLLLGFIPWGYFDMRTEGFWWPKVSRHYLRCWTEDLERVEKLITKLEA